MLFFTSFIQVICVHMSSPHFTQPIKYSFKKLQLVGLVICAQMSITNMCDEISDCEIEIY